MLGWGTLVLSQVFLAQSGLLVTVVYSQWRIECVKALMVVFLTVMSTRMNTSSWSIAVKYVWPFPIRTLQTIWVGLVIRLGPQGMTVISAETSFTLTRTKAWVETCARVYHRVSHSVCPVMQIPSYLCLSSFSTRRPWPWVCDQPRTPRRTRMQPMSAFVCVCVEDKCVSTVTHWSLVHQSQQKSWLGTVKASSRKSLWLHLTKRTWSISSRHYEFRPWIKLF